MKIVCKSCDGTGKITCSSSRGTQFQKECRGCKGTGFLPTERLLKKIASIKAELLSLSPELFEGVIPALEVANAKLSASPE